MREPLESVAALLTPTDGRTAEIITADDRWSLPDLDGSDHFVWGRMPLRPTRMRAMVLHGLRREWSLLRLRLQRVAGGRRVLEVHRLQSPARGGLWRSAARRYLLSGAVAVLGPKTATRRRIDTILDAVGAQPIGAFRPSYDGSLRLRIRRGVGGEGDLRVGTANSPRDPARTAVALSRLAEAGVMRVPRLIAEGSIDGANWSVESFLPGRIPARISARIVDDISDFCASLVVPSLAITSLNDGMAAVRRLRPGSGDLLDAVERWAAKRIEGIPSAIQHRDLWTANLLVEGNRLSGVIDWDTWHPAGMPGVDLLHLVAFAERPSAEDGPGECFLRDIWRTPDFISATHGYWKRIGVTPTDDLLRAVGLDWWVGQIETTEARPIRRRLLQEPDWVRRNVDDVLDALRLVVA